MNKLFLFFLFLAHTVILANEALFTRIYKNKIWGVNADGEGTSGSGSTLSAAQEYIDFVEKFIKEHNVKSVVDVGCGDWEFSQYINWENINYIGYDIVKFVIEKNIERFSAPNIQFRHGSLTATNFPEADLLLCKDVLQHLESSEINTFLPQLKKYKYCLITDGPTINMYNRLHGFNRSIVLTYNGGGEIKKTVLIENL